MLASARHVRIGGIEYFIEESVPSSYRHLYVPLAVQRVDISGRPGRQNLEPTQPLTASDSWDRGEGVKYRDSQNPNFYWQGLANPRRSGQIAPPPTRTDSSTAINRPGSSETPAFLFNAGGALWLGGSKFLRRTTDSDTWSSVTSGIQASGRFTAGTGSPGQKWAYVWDTTAPGDDSGTAEIRRVDSSGTNSTFWTGGSAADTLGMVSLLRRIYTWTGVRLFSYDTSDSLPVSRTLEFSLGVEARTSPFYGDAIATRNTVVMMTAARGDTSLYSFNPAGAFDSTGAAIKVTTQLEPMPRGFTARCLGYSLGVIYVGGTYGDKGCLFAYSSVTSQPLFLKWFRFGIENVIPVSMSAGNGSQMLIACQRPDASTGGFVFVYDAEQNSLSELDETPLEPSIRAVATYTDQRTAVYDDLVTETIYSESWAADDDVSTTVSAVWQSAIDDLDFPEATKILLALRLTFPALTSGQSITVGYATDDNSDAPTYTSLAAVNTVGATSATINVSDEVATVTFKSFRFEVTQAAGAILSSITAVCRIPDSTEQFALVLRIADPEEGEPGGANQSPARTQVKNLRTLKTNEAVAEFVSGYESDLEEGDVSGDGIITRNVTLEDVDIDLGAGVKGVARVLLKAVAGE